MTNPTPLPAGQHLRTDFPRFGIWAFAKRRPSNPSMARLRVVGQVAQPVELNATHWAALPRVTRVCDFHCVTGWTCRDLRWSGVRMRDVHEQLIGPMSQPHAQALWVILRGSDGARSCLPLADLLAEDVLLADQLDGQPLNLAHGAPLRLIAPAHYGYKSIKHLDRLEFCSDLKAFRPSAWRFMDHPRARVALQERGRWLPGGLLRWLYLPLVGPTVRHFARHDPDHIA